MKLRLNQKQMQKKSVQAAALLKALASAPRLMVLCQLADGEQSVRDLWANSALSQSAFSQHLAKLRQEGLVATRKEAQTVYYSLADKAAIEIIKALQKIYC